MLLKAEETVRYFDQFNKDGPSLLEYSQYEYDQHLTDPDWTKHETDYLFRVLKEFDLRFVVAADRYRYSTPGGADHGRRRNIEVSFVSVLYSSGTTFI